MNPPLVSICVPTYNRPDCLARALRSCLAQTYPHFEIVITDNSTTTDSAELVAKLGDSRIRYHKNPSNLGACGNTNRVVSLATGQYLKLLMDDDLLKPRCLELMVDALERHPTAGVVMAPMELIDANDRRIFPKFYVFRTMRYRYRYQVGDGLIPRRRVARDFLTRDYPCCVPSGIMFRLDALRPFMPFDPAADFAGDLDMLMRMSSHFDFYYIDQVLTSWRYMPVCHTASLHQTGMNIGAFYYLTRKCLADPVVQRLFDTEWKQVVRQSLLFCSCRALLNGLAGLRSASPGLIFSTLRTIAREDGHWTNLLRLPLFVAREIFVSIFPPRLPPARE